jgi:tetratricopeptide (TPR) repeat protein
MADKQSLLKSAELLAEGADPLAAILAGSHPLMLEAFYLAAIPQWYDVALLDALRLRDDGREAGLVERLARYSFVVPSAGAKEEHPAYYVRSQERAALHRRWIAEDATAYRAAHARALAFWEEHPDPNAFAQAQNRLYHLLFVDFWQGIQLLLDRFRAYRNDRHLPAIERLLDTAREAQSHLALLEHELAATFQDLIAYLAARLAQLRGDWATAAAALEPLFARFDTLEPSLRPYLLRARAYDLARQGHYARAIAGLKQSLQEFNRPVVAGSQWGIIEAERGYTLVALGDAYVDLAVAAGGRGSLSPYRGAQNPQQEGLWARLWPALYFVVSLPLVLYLSFTLGRRAWHPRFWPALIGLDWIVARLMATGARYYRRADAILESYGKAAEGLVADEKLAALYLHLGDAGAAEQLCRRLLAPKGCSLGPYRRALVQVILGDALLGLGRPDEARGPLREAERVLDDYVDDAGQARALELLGMALLATGQQEEAMLHLAGRGAGCLAAERAGPRTLGRKGSRCRAAATAAPVPGRLSPSGPALLPPVHPGLPTCSAAVGAPSEHHPGHQLGLAPCDAFPAPAHPFGEQRRRADSGLGPGPGRPGRQRFERRRL